MRTLAVTPPERTVRVLAYAAGALFLSGIMIVGLSRPVPVLGALFVTGVVVAVMRFPVTALIVLLFLQPFNTLIISALANRAHLEIGPLTYWKDALILSLFVRAVIARLQADRRLRLPADPGDKFLLVFVLAYAAMAALSPPRPSVPLALGRYVEGPLLLLSIKFLRPTRRQLWFCAGALLAAATIIGTVAVIERLGPQERLLTWYGAPEPARNSSFFVGEHGYRSGSFLNSPLILGFYLAGAMPFALALAFLRSRWRIAALIGVAGCAGGLVATVTRSGFLGGGLGVILVLGLALRNPRIRFSVVGLVILTTGSVAIYYAATGSETFLRQEGTESHREALSKDLRILERQPFGYGLGTTDALQQRFGLQGVPGATESTYMARALEGGIQALVLYLLALFVTGMRVRAVRLRARREGDEGAALLALGALGAMVGIAVSGLFLGILELVVELVLWGAPGIALASSVAAPRPRPVA